MVHDLAIDAVSAATPPLTAGQAASIEFTAPETPGDYDIPLPAACAHDEGRVDSRGIGAARAKARAYETTDPQSAIRTTLSPVSLREAISTPAGKAPYVRRLFDTIADRYDLITVLLSYGQDRRWKRRLIDLAGPLAGPHRARPGVRNRRSRVARIRRGARVTGARRHLSHDRVGQGKAAVDERRVTPGSSSAT